MESINTDIRLNITIFSSYIVYFGLRELAISLEVRYTRLVETDLNSYLSLYSKLIFVISAIDIRWHIRYWRLSAKYSLQPLLGIYV